MVASSVATSQSTLFQLTHTRQHKRQHKRQHERPDVTRGAAPALEGGLVCSLVSDSDLSVRVCGKCGTRVRIGYLSGELRGSEIEGGTTTLNSFSVSQLRIAKARAVRSLRRVRSYSVIHSGYSYTNRSRGLGDDVPPNLRSIFRVEAQRACSAQLNGYGGARQTRSSMIDCRQPWSPRWSPAEAQAPWAVRATRPLASSEAARHRTHRPETSALASGHPPRPRPSYRQIHEPPKPVERLR